MSLPRLAVIIPTLNRHAIVRRTVELLQTRLLYSGERHIYVSADGEPLPSGIFADMPNVTAMAGPSKGYGANLNSMLIAAQEQLIFQCDDDMHLMHPLEINPHAMTLLSDDTAGWIRLFGVGYHRFAAELDGTYWRVDWERSFELHIPSMRCHLKHRRFHEHYGMFPVGLKIGETEAGFGHQCKDVHASRGGPNVLVPLYPVPDEWWYHADGGVSWREKELS